ncbi:ATP-dependent 3'-5' DNA helicase [Aspergillus melleus]|uniref:ATP-dependent 3'-5' DNA helicase n=1 Tax=Aspergillus melleus TaxID=138277 RepID=UPI001E8CB88D|nr:ATP-dependent 3'-5' DNA helicase [Aspergillus melleus]KAH8424563.1 ATP-dependent 3'-5' DNA helicase [Aspergillus melleus]
MFQPAAITAEDSQASDNEGGERPVRNKLKETSITSVPVPESSSTEQPQPQAGGTLSRDSSRGRKRSFDDDESGKSDGENGDDDEMDDAGHRRKRSRDSSYEEANANAALSKTEDGQQLGELKDAEALSRKILSPKKKRSRDQLDKDETKIEDSAKESESKTAVAAAENGAPTETSATEGEPEKKRHRDASQEREKVGRSFVPGWEPLYFGIDSALARPPSQAHSPTPPPSLPSGRWVLHQQRRKKNRSPQPPHPRLPLPRQPWPPSPAQSNLLSAR